MGVRWEMLGGGPEQLFCSESQDAKHEVCEDLWVTPDPDESSSEAVLDSRETTLCDGSEQIASGFRRIEV